MSSGDSPGGGSHMHAPGWNHANTRLSDAESVRVSSSSLGVCCSPVHAVRETAGCVRAATYGDRHLALAPPAPSRTATHRHACSVRCMLQHRHPGAGPRQAGSSVPGRSVCRGGVGGVWGGASTAVNQDGRKSPVRSFSVLTVKDRRVPSLPVYKIKYSVNARRRCDGVRG